jgi:hypothetical protein
MLQKFHGNIQAFVSNVWVQLAIGLILLVVSWKMNASWANEVLFAAWAIFISCVFRSTWLITLDLIPRLLVTLCFAGALGLGIYYTLWTRARPTGAVSPGNLEVQALLFPDPYPDNTDFGGIRWLSIDSDVRVNFINRAPVPLQNLEFIVSFDNAQIKAVANLDNYPGISVLRSNASGPDSFWLTTAENAAIPAQMPLAKSYRIRCEKIFDNSIIHFSIAVFSVGRPPDDTSNDPFPKKLVRRPPPAIHIKGSYEIPSISGFEKRPIDFSHSFPASMTPDAAAVAATLPRPPSPTPNSADSSH